MSISIIGAGNVGMALGQALTQRPQAMHDSRRIWAWPPVTAIALTGQARRHL